MKTHEIEQRKIISHGPSNESLKRIASIIAGDGTGTCLDERELHACHVASLKSEFDPPSLRDRFNHGLPLRFCYEPGNASRYDLVLASVAGNGADRKNCRVMLVWLNGYDGGGAFTFSPTQYISAKYLAEKMLGNRYSDENRVGSDVWALLMFLFDLGFSVEHPA